MGQAVDLAFTQWNECMQKNISIYYNDSEAMWRNLYKAIQLCERLPAMKNIHMQNFQNSDETIYHILTENVTRMGQAVDLAFAQWNECMQKNISIYYNDSEAMWRNLYKAIQLCERLPAMKNIHMQNFQKSDETIYHILTENVTVQAVASTWLPRCDHGEFFSDSFPKEKNSTKLDDNFQPSSDVPLSNVFAMIPDKYNLLFEKILAALEFAYKRYPDFDWYYKADDDTFVVMENLRSLLDQYNSSKPYYIGYRMKPYMVHGYNAGGAGYVLSSAALKLFNEKLLRNRVLCPFDINEDVGIGRCFESLGIFPIDTRNSKGQQRFNTYNTLDIYHRRIAEEWHFDKQLPGSEAMAADLISLHHLTTDEVLFYDHLIYKVARQLTMNDRKRRKINLTP